MMTSLIASLWQGLAIAIATELILRCTPRINAATRYVVWWMALAAVLALPVAHVLLEPATVPSSRHAIASGATPLALVLPTPPDWLIACVAGVWLGTVLIGLGRIVRGLAQVASLKRRSRPLDRSIAQRLTHWKMNGSRVRHAELRASRDIAGACALGLFGSPVIVLSERLVATLDDETIDQIVLHEQAHLSRYDDWTTLAQTTVRALLGLHPAVRIIDARIDFEREATCDDVVVMKTGGAARYARCLAQAADAVAAESRMLAALTPNAIGHGRLLVRVQRLLDPRVPRHGRLQLTAAATGFLAFAAAAATGPNARFVVVADPFAMPPAVHGEPAHRAFDWASRAALMHRLPVEATATVTVSAEAVNQGPVVTPVTPSTDYRIPLAVPASVAIFLESSDDPPLSEPAPLQSRTLTSAVVPTVVRSVEDSGAGWSTAGQSGAAIGVTFARIGMATGIGTKRASVAVGGFFSRAGKAVADSF